MILRLNSLSGNIVRFCRYLRHHGFAVSADDEAITLEALQYIDYTSFSIFSLAVKSVLCRSKKQFEEFDRLFATYWKELDKAVDAKINDENVDKKPLRSQQEQFKALKTWLHGDHNNEKEETSTYSRQENLSRKDFSYVTEDELDEMMQIIRAIGRQLAVRANRRYEASREAGLPDLRRTIRKNLRRGGELLEIIHRKPKKNRVKLVMLCDVSRSMELYTAFLVQFMYAFQQVFSRVETFVFGTSLKNVTPMLKGHDFRTAMQEISLASSGWNGGTRIGASLDEFASEYAKKMLDRNTIVVILSDGWDTGDLDILQRSMEFIHARARKLIWLNPLAGYQAYQPDVAGMKIALPHTDVFASAHNAESLRKLGKILMSTMR